MPTTVIRPGILVSLKSTVSGGVTYRRDDIADQSLDNGAHLSKWQTEKVVEDPVEHEAATKVRSKALGTIRGICSHTSFGLLCPIEFEGKLDEAVRAARSMVAEFNASAQFTRVSIYALKGRIASTDEEAARAIGSEVAALVASMNEAIDQLDPNAIREAANRARSMSAMLSDEQQTKVNDAIAQARKAARQIVKRIEKDGEQAAIVLKDIQRGDIEKARIAFLDLDAPTEPAPAGEAMPVVNVQRVAELELDAEPATNAGDVQ